MLSLTHSSFRIARGFFAALILCFAAALPASTSTRAAEPLRILAFGDSITAGLGLEGQDTLTTQLADALAKMGRPATVINAGVSGDTTTDGLARIDWTLAGLTGADKPQIMILALGANDMLRGLDPSMTRANLEAIIAKAKAAKIEVLLVGMLAMTNLGPDYKSQFDAIFPDLAKAHKLVFMPFLLQDVAQNSGFNQADGIHPNGEGVAIIVRNMIPFVTEAMDRAAKAQGT